MLGLVLMAADFAAISAFGMLGFVFVLEAALVLNIIGRSRLQRELNRILANQCRNCGYSLEQNVSGTCPECGTPAPAKA